MYVAAGINIPASDFWIRGNKRQSFGKLHFFQEELEAITDPTSRSDAYPKIGIAIAFALVRTSRPPVRKDVSMLLYQFLLVAGFVLTTATALDIKRVPPSEDLF